MSKMNDLTGEKAISLFEKAKDFCKKHIYVALITAGALMALPFVFGAAFFLTYFSFIAFYLFIRGGDGKKFKKCFIFFLSYYVTAYCWFTSLYPIDVFKMSSFESCIVIFLIWTLISSIHALITSFVLFLSLKIRAKGALFPFVLSALWIVDEWLLSLGGFAFPWASLALSQSFFLPQVQTASLFGSLFISLVVTLSSFLFGEWIRSRRRCFAYAALAVFGANVICGTVLYFVPSKEVSSFDAAVVQGDIGTGEKWNKENVVKIYNTYVDLTEKAASDEKVKLVLLPESAIPVYFVKNGTVHKAFAAIAAKYDVTVMFGSLCQEDDLYYNSVFAIFPDGSVSERYDKQKLVPLIESLPYDDVLSYYSLLRLIPAFSDEKYKEEMYQSGKGAVLIELPDGAAVSPFVCFDTAFPSVVREGVNKGASLIASVSNDSWYHDGLELYMHRNIAAIRSIENGRYTVRAANTGISCVIDDKGRVLAQTEPSAEDTLICTVRIIESKTLYTLIGDVPVYVSLAFLLFSFGFSLYKNKFKKTV